VGRGAIFRLRAVNAEKRKDDLRHIISFNNRTDSRSDGIPSVTEKNPEAKAVFAGFQEDSWISSFAQAAQPRSESCLPERTIAGDAAWITGPSRVFAPWWKKAIAERRRRRIMGGHKRRCIGILVRKLSAEQGGGGGGGGGVGLRQEGPAFWRGHRQPFPGRAGHPGCGAGRVLRLATAGRPAISRPKHVKNPAWAIALHAATKRSRARIWPRARSRSLDERCGQFRRPPILTDMAAFKT